MPSTSGYLDAVARAEQAARTAEPAFGIFFLAKFHPRLSSPDGGSTLIKSAPASASIMVE
jgi:hypothetical protein